MSLRPARGGPKHGVEELSSCAYNLDDAVILLQLAKAGGWGFAELLALSAGAQALSAWVFVGRGKWHGTDRVP